MCTYQTLKHLNHMHFKPLSHPKKYKFPKDKWFMSPRWIISGVESWSFLVPLHHHVLQCAIRWLFLKRHSHAKLNQFNCASNEVREGPSERDMTYPISIHFSDLLQEPKQPQSFPIFSREYVPGIKIPTPTQSKTS